MSRSKMSRHYTGCIVFQGGSSLAGMGDQEGRMGYRGRVHTHYQRYLETALTRSAEARPDCFWVTTHGDGIIDTDALHYASRFDVKVGIALEESRMEGWEQRGVAVLLFGSFLGRLLRQESPENALTLYRESIDTLQSVCENRKLSVIGLMVPMPDRTFRFANGREPNFDMRRLTTELSAEHLTRWRVPAEVAYMDAIAPDPTDRAADGAHLNAQGYEKVATYLTGRIDSLLGIDSSFLRGC